MLTTTAATTTTTATATTTAANYNSAITNYYDLNLYRKDYSRS